MTRALLNDYIAVLRPRYWPRNLFLLFGSFGSWYLAGSSFHASEIGRVVAALLCAVMVSSANYILNGVLDIPFDAVHPVKKERPLPAGRINVGAVMKLFAALLLLAFALGYFFIGGTFLMGLLVLFVAGILYNVAPFRLKDMPYVDVLAESVNSPIRFYLGWHALGAAHHPPLYALLFFWAFSAAIIASRRLSELLALGQVQAAHYRRTYAAYSTRILTLQYVGYSLLSLAGMSYGIYAHLPHRVWWGVAPCAVLLGLLYARARKKPLERPGYYGAALTIYGALFLIFMVWLMLK